MKKILISFLVISLAFVSCKKKETAPAPAPTPAPAPAPTPVQLTDTMTVRFGVILYRGINHNIDPTNKAINDSVTRVIIKNSKYSYTTSFVVPKPDTITYSSPCAQPAVSCPFVLTKNATCTITIYNGEFAQNSFPGDIPTFTVNTAAPMSSPSSGLQLINGQGTVCHGGTLMNPTNTALVW